MHAGHAFASLAALELRVCIKGTCIDHLSSELTVQAFFSPLIGTFLNDFGSGCEAIMQIHCIIVLTGKTDFVLKSAAKDMLKLCTGSPAPVPTNLIPLEPLDRPLQKQWLSS